MVKIAFHPDFDKIFLKIKDKGIKDIIIKQFSKIKENPEIGKPMKYNRKGTIELYISPFRLFYRLENEIVYMLDIYHKDEQ